MMRFEYGSNDDKPIVLRDIYDTTSKQYFPYVVIGTLKPVLWNSVRHYLTLNLSNGETVDVELDNFYWFDESATLESDKSEYNGVEVVTASQISRKKSELYDEYGFNKRLELLI